MTGEDEDVDNDNVGGVELKAEDEVWRDEDEDLRVKDELSDDEVKTAGRASPAVAESSKGMDVGVGNEEEEEERGET